MTVSCLVRLVMPKYSLEAFVHFYITQIAMKEVASAFRPYFRADLYWCAV